MDKVERTVHEVVLRIAREKALEIAGVDNSQGLTAALGMDSLDIARLIATLELKLGVDPFAKLAAITDMRTVGDLCTAYRAALAPAAAPAPLPSFAASEKRAEARRRAPPRSGPRT
jgi:acyl carrier protein